MRYPQLALVLCALALGGCMSASEVNFERYTLTQDVKPEAYLHDYAVKLTLAPILNQGGVVLQTSDVTLRPAKNFRYSTNLSDELSLLVCDELIAADAPKDLSYEVYVAKFQGTVDGAAVVTVAFKVRKQADPITAFSPVARKGQMPLPPVLLSKSYERSSALTADGYSALVHALKANFRAAVQDFAHDLQQSTP